MVTSWGEVVVGLVTSTSLVVSSVAAVLVDSSGGTTDVATGGYMW